MSRMGLFRPARLGRMFGTMRSSFFALAATLLLGPLQSKAATTLLEFSIKNRCYISQTASDAAGNIYVCGRAETEAGLPGKESRLGPTDGTDLFVMKLNAKGDTIAAVVLGGSGLEYSERMAVDAQGNVALVGVTTSTNFPTKSPFASAGSQGPDLFICKLDSSLTNLLFSSYLGTGGYLIGVAFDPEGNIRLAGNASAPGLFSDFLENTSGAFVAQVAADGSGLSYVKRVGADAYLYAFAVDGDGNSCAVGITYSSTLPILNALQPVKPSPEYSPGGFLVRLDKHGELLTSTFLGGMCGEDFAAVGFNAAKDIYIAGMTWSGSIAGRPLATNECISGSAFFLKLNPDATQVLQAELLELSINNPISSMAVSPDGTAYLSGVINGSYLGLPFLTTVSATGKVTTRYPLHDCQSLDSVDGISLEPSGTILSHGQHSQTVYSESYRVTRITVAELNRKPQPFVHLAPSVQGGAINDRHPPQFLAVPLGFTEPIQSVSFFDGKTFLGRVTTPPYFLSLPPLSKGAHSFAAVVRSVQRDYTSCAVPVKALSPRNDDFANRIRLTGRERRIRGNTIAATPEQNEPPYRGGLTVWYSWTPAFDGVAELSIQEKPQNGFTTGIGGRVFTGNSITGLTGVADTDFGVATFRVSRGSNYKIQISGYGHSHFNMTVRQVTPPPNDEFTNATVIAEAGAFPASLRNASVEPGEQSAKSIWYRWTTPTAGLFLAAVPYGLGYVQVYTGTHLTNLVSIGQNVYGLTNGVAWRAAPEENYFISVSTYGAGTNFLLSVSPELPPVNDNFAERLSIPMGGLTATGSCLGATRELDEPGNIFPSLPTVWWRWVAPSSGVYRSSLVVPFAPSLGAQYGTPLQPGSQSVTLYLGTDLANLSPPFGSPTFPYSNDQDWHVEQGTEYQIAVSGNASRFILQLTWVPPPPNDNFSAAATLNGFSPAIGTTTGASVEPGEPIHLQYFGTRASVWYRWVAPSNGFFTLVSFGNVKLYTGETLAALSTVPLVGGLTFRAEEGTTYHLAVFDSGTFTVRVRPAQRPANDDFARATQLAGADFSFPVNLAEATAEAGEPDYSDLEPALNSVWYAWTAPTNGSFGLRATDYFFYGRITVYSGDTLTNLTLVRSGPIVEFQALAGEKFFFSMDDDYGGQFSVRLRFFPQLSNDYFTNAIVLDGSGFSLSVTNLGATREPNEPFPDFYVSHSVWYKWTVPLSGRVSFNFDADFTSILALYTGHTLTSLVPVLPSNNGTLSRFNVAVEAGVTYWLSVNGYINDAGGGILDIHYTPVPVNDAFTNRLAVIDNQGSGTVEGASREPSDPFVDEEPLGGSVWWTFTPATNGVHRISWSATDYLDSLRADVFRGNSLASLEHISSPGNYQPVRFIGEAGVPVVIEFLGALGSLAHFDFVVTHEPPPENDFFTNRIAFTNSARGTLQGATMEPDEPNEVGGEGSSVWWSWVAPQSGLYEFKLTEPTYGSTINSLDVQLYTGTNLTQLQALPNHSDRYFSPLFNVTAGTTYAISIAYPALAGDNFRLTPTLRVSPINDHFTNRIALTGSVFSVSGGMRYATREPGEANWGGVSVWYSWTPEFSGAAAIDIVGGYYDFDFFVGETLENLSYVGGARYFLGDPISATIPVYAGTNYQLRIAQAFDFPSNTGFTFTITTTPFSLARPAGPKPVPGRGVALVIPSGGGGVIETSTNLVDWTPWGTNAPGTSLLTPVNAEPQRFFRVR